MIRYLKLLWLLISSLFCAIAGWILALTIILPFTLRYSSPFSRPPQWFYTLSGIVGYGLPILFFTASFITLWRSADAHSSACDAKIPSKDLVDESED